MADGSVIIGVSLDTTMFYRTIELLEARVTGLSSSMASSLSSAFSGQELFVSADGAFKRIYNSATTNFTNIYNKIKESADNAALYFKNGPWMEAGTSAASTIGTGISAGTPAINASILGVMTKITSTFSGGWETIGRSISSGVAAGIIAGENEVVSAAKKVSVDTNKAFKTHLQIASPSKLMRNEVGIMISRGIAEGITDGSSFISSAISSVYGSIDPNGSRARENVRNSSLTQNIYLRDSDFSPYRTAKRIKRESEAIFEI